jgi:hypothetical protein
MFRMIEGYRVECPLVGQALSNTNVTGRYISANRMRRALFILNVGALAVSKTCKLEIMQAKTVAAGSAEAISGLTATITANTKVKKVTVALASVGTGDTVTVTTYLHGVQADTATFTKGSADEGLGFTNAAGLEAAIIANITGATAADSTTNVLITALDGYTITVTSTDVGGAVTVATNEAIVAVDVLEANISGSSGFCFLAPKVTSTGNGNVTVTVLMEMKDLPVGQGDVGAAYPA